MKPVYIIGMGLAPDDLTARHLNLIKDADILIGGKRHLKFFGDFPGSKKEITKDIKGIVKYIKCKMLKKTIVVLASGDPLFFGIGNLLINALGPENVFIYPNISTVAAAFSRIKEPWHDVCVKSLHGRQCEMEILSSLGEKDTVAVFTDPNKNPAWLANFLLEKGIDDFKICVLEQLGTPSERVDWYTLSSAADMKFSEPNIAILKRISPQTEKKRSLSIGMPEDLYDHHKGLITKAEVRAVTLSKLCLMSEHIFWDLGAGSGSIGIEASLIIKKGTIFAIEQNSDRIKQIKGNKKRFKVKNLKIMHAVLPEGLENLPKPDRIFIGGGGKNLNEIIKSASSYIKPSGIMVINTVLISNLDTALNTLKSIGFKTEFVQVQISHGRDMPWGERLEAQNPVWIISGMRDESFKR